MNWWQSAELPHCYMFILNLSSFMVWWWVAMHSTKDFTFTIKKNLFFQVIACVLHYWICGHCECLAAKLNLCSIYKQFMHHFPKVHQALSIPFPSHFFTVKISDFCSHTSAAPATSYETKICLMKCLWNLPMKIRKQLTKTQKALWVYLTKLER